MGLHTHAICKIAVTRLNVHFFSVNIQPATRGGFAAVGCITTSKRLLIFTNNGLSVYCHNNVTNVSGSFIKCKKLHLYHNVLMPEKPVSDTIPGSVSCHILY